MGVAAPAFVFHRRVPTRAPVTKTVSQLTILCYLGGCSKNPSTAQYSFLLIPRGGWCTINPVRKMFGKGLFLERPLALGTHAMPLSCDCYDGCWGDHSKHWPSIRATNGISIDVLWAVSKRVVPYGSYVRDEDEMRFETVGYQKAVSDEVIRMFHG